MTPITQVLTQYGAVGLIAVVALWVARTLFQKWNDAHDAELVALRASHGTEVARLAEQLAKADERTAREAARADRVTEELARLNELVRNDYINALARTNQALADASRDIAVARSANARRR